MGRRRYWERNTEIQKHRKETGRDSHRAMDTQTHRDIQKYGEKSIRETTGQ